MSNPPADARAQIASPQCDGQLGTLPFATERIKALSTFTEANRGVSMQHVFDRKMSSIGAMLNDDPPRGSRPAGAKHGAQRGAFIVLEGLDRSGKTTQVKLLEQRLIEEGRPVKALRFPDRSTAIGQMIDGYLKSEVKLDDHAVHLLFSANRWEVADKIKRLLLEGTTVICDRYYHSGVVYSAAKQNPDLPLSWARTPDSGLPKPDAVIFLDLTEEVAQQRGGWGGERYERADLQRRVRDLFKGLTYTEGGWLKSDAEGLEVVDAGRDMESVANSIWDVVRLVKTDGAIKSVE